MVDEDTAHMRIDGGVFAAVLSPDFRSDNTCFAAGASGLFCSRDAGDTWKLALDATEPGEELSVLALALSPDYEHDGVLFAGMHGGVLRSWDGSESWAAKVLPPPMPTVSSIGISPVFPKDSILFAGTFEDGVLRSSDGGLNFTSWNFGLLDSRILTLVVSPDFEVDDTVFVSSESGIFRSKNGGRSWREVDLPVSAVPALSLAISPGFADDGLLFGGTESSGLYKSSDAGESWTSIMDERLSGPINCIAFSSGFLSDSSLFVATTQQIYFSEDCGVKWYEWAQIPDVMALSVSPSSEGHPQVLAGTATGGVGWVLHDAVKLRATIAALST